MLDHQLGRGSTFEEFEGIVKCVWEGSAARGLLSARKTVANQRFLLLVASVLEAPNVPQFVA